MVYSIYKNIFFLILISFTFSCGEKDAWEEMAEENKKLEKQLAKDHAILKSYQKDSYNIPNSSQSRDEAIRSYLEDMKKSSGGDAKHALNQKELREILYPNSLGIGTSLDNTPLAEYEKLVWERRQLGEDRILEKWTPNSKIIKIQWEENPRTYGALIGHKPDSIVVLTNGKKLNISHIKQVIEHKGQFKVAIIAP